MEVFQSWSCTEQRAAAASQANVNNQLVSQGNDNQRRVNENMDLIKPYATSRLNGGLPFFNALTDYNSGTISRSFQPARMTLEKRLSGYGSLTFGIRRGRKAGFRRIAGARVR
jgi:hypothetical protein